MVVTVIFILSLCFVWGAGFFFFFFFLIERPRRTKQPALLIDICGWK